MKWQEEVLTGNHKRTVVRACRRAGKTHTAIRWARHAAKRVLYAVPNTNQVRMVVEKFRSLYHDEIYLSQTNTGKVVFNDGTSIQVIAATNENRFTGVQVDAVVVDELGYICQPALSAILLCLATGEGKLLALTTKTTTNSYDVMLSLGHIHHIVVDYLDLLEEDAIELSKMRDLIDMIGLEEFQEEFGPWEHPTNGKENNKDFSFLLEDEPW